MCNLHGLIKSHVHQHKSVRLGDNAFGRGRVFEKGQQVIIVVYNIIIFFIQVICQLMSEVQGF